MGSVSELGGIMKNLPHHLKPDEHALHGAAVTVTATISKSYSNKSPQTDWFKIEMYYLIVLETRSLILRCDNMASSQDSEGGYSIPLS